MLSLGGLSHLSISVVKRYRARNVRCVIAVGVHLGKILALKVDPERIIFTLRVGGLNLNGHPINTVEILRGVDKLTELLLCLGYRLLKHTSEVLSVSIFLEFALIPLVATRVIGIESYIGFVGHIDD